jgi:hypothetical protein
MEEVFVTRASAVARILRARKALLKDGENADGSGARDTTSRLERLDRLLFDVRSGRTHDFEMPSDRGETRVFVTGD